MTEVLHRYPAVLPDHPQSDPSSSYPGDGLHVLFRYEPPCHADACTVDSSDLRPKRRHHTARYLELELLQQTRNRRQTWAVAGQATTATRASMLPVENLPWLV
jgi:hypothetical protein